MMIELPKFNPEMIDRRDVAALAEEAGLRKLEDGSRYQGEWDALASLVLLCWRIADKHFATPPKDKEAMHVIEGKIQELEQSAGELASDVDGYVTEAAVDIGFHMVNDDGNVYLTNDAQILELVRRVRSKPLEDIEKLTAENARLREGAAKANNEVCQVLGKALGYPWFKDDPKNFPEATKADGVCVGEHVAESIAVEAVKKIERLQGIAKWHEDVAKTATDTLDL